MAMAEHFVARSNEFVSRANASGDPATAKRDAIAGWHQLQGAIAEVVACGCDRDLWPASVRAKIPTG
jgi:Zn ribbon nucleic-acid-binding protein